MSSTGYPEVDIGGRLIHRLSSNLPQTTFFSLTLTLLPPPGGCWQERCQQTLVYFTVYFSSKNLTSVYFTIYLRSKNLTSVYFTVYFRKSKYLPNDSVIGLYRRPLAYWEVTIQSKSRERLPVLFKIIEQDQEQA